MTRSWPFLIALLALPSGAQIHFAHQASEFRLENCESENRYAPETMAGGVALFDYDGDGDLDLYFANGAELPENRKAAGRYSNRLFENDGKAGFTDVTSAAGLAGKRFDFGVAAADYDNDGDQDLFVAGLHGNTLYRNDGEGRFSDVTATSGIGSGDPEFGDLWAVAGAWFDYDNDGLLDLFIVNYLSWGVGADPVCDTAGPRDYCHPKHYTGTPNRLYRNRGDGTFEDVSASAGIRAHVGKGMGAAIADFDGNGFLDVFVTNDKLPNFLFSNGGDGQFEETAFEATIALPEHGQDVSGMGLDARDLDGDGLAEVVYAALPGETFPLMRNMPDAYFVDITGPSGIAEQTRDMAGYSAIIADFDNDTLKDIFFSRGDVQVHPIHQGVQIRQHNSVFRNIGERGYLALTEEAGFDSAPPRRHRGAAVGDLNGDGKLDLVVTALEDPAEIWINDSESTAGWLGVELEGVSSNRDGIGAVVRVETSQGVQFNHATTSVGYASSSGGPVHFGVGTASEVRSVVVEWPSGGSTTVRGVPPNQILHLREDQVDTAEGG